MIKKTIILLVLYFFCRFTLLVCGEKNILANLTNSQEQEPVGAGCFWLLGAGARAEAVAGAAWEKIRSRSRLKKKVRSRKKFAGSPALDKGIFNSLVLLFF